MATSVVRKTWMILGLTLLMSLIALMGLIAFRIHAHHVVCRVSIGKTHVRIQQSAVNHVLDSSQKQEAIVSLAQMKSACRPNDDKKGRAIAGYIATYLTIAGNIREFNVLARYSAAKDVGNDTGTF